MRLKASCDFDDVTVLINVREILELDENGVIYTAPVRGHINENASLLE